MEEGPDEGTNDQDLARLIAACSAMFISNPASAEEGFAVISGDPAEQVLRLRGWDGRMYLVDNQTQTILVTDVNGNIHEVSFSDAAAYNTDSAAERDAMIAQLALALTDYASLGTLTDSTTPRLADKYQRPGGVGVVKPQRVKPGGTLTTMSGDFGDFNDDLGGPCDLAPCTPFFTPGTGRIYYRQDSYSGTVGNGSVAAQESFANDFWQWADEQDEACEERNLAALELNTTAAITGASCAAAETGIGAVVCAGGIVLIAIQQRRANKLHAECSATYPGPGNW